MIFYCEKCGRKYPDDKTPYKCLFCGSQFYPDFNLINLPENYFESLEKTPFWRYKETFGLGNDVEPVHLGEGNTPLISYFVNDKRIFLKLESLNPTGSYKDRNSALLISYFKKRNIKKFVEDSSGNAGASISAYASRAKIKAKIFAPSYTSEAKIKQIKAFNPELCLVDGNRQDTTNALLNELKKGEIYGSHAFMPFGIPGIATIAYELFESINDEIKNIFVPVGHGGLLYGIIWGYEVLLRNGFIEKLPHFYGVQAEKCSPFVLAKEHKYEKLGFSTQGDSIAEGIMITNPSKQDVLLDYARRGVLEFLAVSEDEIKDAHRELCENGLLVELTSAVVLAAIKKITIFDIEDSIAIISGNGLKSI